MKLVIAEKPSVAQSLARVIGADKRQDGYLEGGGYLVSWCVGHLVELSAPERYDERFAKWRIEDLPILPERWLYEVSQATRKQYQILKSLMERSDVTSLVCATDAGREGELIFRLVYNQAQCKKPFERLWISSMEDAAIQEGFEKLKPGTQYDLLYEAAPVSYTHLDVYKRQDKTPWASFVLPTKAVHENQYGKGLWTKIPADETTAITKPTLQGQDDKGKNIWQDVKTQVPNRDLKTMVEAYKTRAPQEKSAQPKESAREKLDALVKDTASKVAVDKPKAKTKSKKGPEL